MSDFPEISFATKWIQNVCHNSGAPEHLSSIVTHQTKPASTDFHHLKWFLESDHLQCSCSGWTTGKGKKLSSNQAQLGQATCWAVA